MKLTFKRPRVPNFVITQVGSIPVQDLSEEELTEFAELWCHTLKENAEKKRSNKCHHIDDGGYCPDCKTWESKRL